MFTGAVAPAANSGAVIQSVVMDYGDGTTQPLGAITGTSITLHHVYVASGTFTATLTATDSNGGVGKSATSVFVQNATPLAVSVTSSQVSSGGNTTVSFTATVIGLGNAVVVNYHWVFGGSNGTADTSNNRQTQNLSDRQRSDYGVGDDHDIGWTNRHGFDRHHAVNADPGTLVFRPWLTFAGVGRSPKV